MSNYTTVQRGDEAQQVEIARQRLELDRYKVELDRQTKLDVANINRLTKLEQDAIDQQNAMAHDVSRIIGT